mmetsp:Transcript_46474/g.86691  ORF Transcript_46474/g.86691 Transcript_46474/m.86691 type:complete len:206 (+) Transcript_46474:663-1280(+)
MHVFNFLVLPACALACAAPFAATTTPFATGPLGEHFRGFGFQVVGHVLHPALLLAVPYFPFKLRVHGLRRVEHPSADLPEPVEHPRDGEGHAHGQTRTKALGEARGAALLCTNHGHCNNCSGARGNTCANVEQPTLESIRHVPWFVRRKHGSSDGTHHFFRLFVPFELFGRLFPGCFSRHFRCWRCCCPITGGNLGHRCCRSHGS